MHSELSEGEETQETYRRCGGKETRETRKRNWRKGTQKTYRRMWWIVSDTRDRHAGRVDPGCSTTPSVTQLKSPVNQFSLDPASSNLYSPVTPRAPSVPPPVSTRGK
ncbi:hypothetical protein Pmani_021377 [Petrolisthes manimaculis]|uniref:Uncharacterized protein n=1 Tax=Petrolisthes manimaculis TaxID=1843537 RepID=A0AAE1U1R3_9EUCA|nr:hypothetical protein Pmani_021377 [Petrolisthes manimaculis]